MVALLMMASFLCFGVIGQADGAVYRGGSDSATGSAGSPSTGSPGGGGKFYHYDLNPGLKGGIGGDSVGPKSLPTFPLGKAIREDLCAGMYHAGNFSPRLRQECAQAIGGQMMGVPVEDLSPDRSKDGLENVCMTSAQWEVMSIHERGQTTPFFCWAPGPRNGSGKIWTDNYTNQIHYSHYDRDEVVQAGNVIAWNVILWRYDVNNSDPAKRKPQPFFQRRIDLGGHGNQASNSQLTWWTGGHGTKQDGTGAGSNGGYYWAPGASAGPLGPGMKGTGDTPASCTSRWASYRNAYGATLGVGSKSLREYLNAGAGRNICFWPSGVKSAAGYHSKALTYDNNQSKDGMQEAAESVGLSWTFNRNGGKANLNFLVQGQPNHLYLAQVVAIDNREAIMGQTAQFFFSDNWEKDCTPGEDPKCTPPPACLKEPCGATRTGTSPEFKYPKPAVDLTGATTAIAGRPADYGMDAFDPEAHLAGETMVVKKTRLSISDPNEQNNIPNAQGGALGGLSYYDQAMTFAETNGGGTDPRTWAGGVPPGSPQFSPGQGSRQSIQDVLHKRDESGLFGGNAYITRDLPLAERGQKIAWLEPSDSAEAFTSIFGDVLYDSAVRDVPIHSPREKDVMPPAKPQFACSTGQPTGEWCLNHDSTLRAWAADGTNDGRLTMSDHWPGKHQLALAYHWQQENGAFKLRLSTNDPDRVENLSIYRRDSANGSRAGRATERIDGEWDLYFCRPGRWADARILRGTTTAALANQSTAFNLSTDDANYGDSECRRDFWRWEWAQTPPETDLNACRPGQPGWGAVRSWIQRDGIPQGADVRGHLPNEDTRRCAFINSSGYVQDGRWKSTDWEWRWNAASKDTCYGNVPSKATIRYDASPEDGNGNRKPAPLPSAQDSRCAAGKFGGHVDGFWFRGGYTWLWGDGRSCARNQPALPNPPSAWGNAGAYQAHGNVRKRIGDRSNSSRLFYASHNGSTRANSTPPRCDFRDPTGYQWTGSFANRPAEPGFRQVTARANFTPGAVNRGRLGGGEYQLVADFRPGANANTLWRMDVVSLEPKGSSWEWSANRWEPGGTIRTKVLSLQQTR